MFKRLPLLRMFILIGFWMSYLVSGLTAQTTDFREETIYFVLTTRFYDGDPTNNRPNEWCSYDPTNPSRLISDPNDVTWRGDFKGLIQKLDYIKDLGFTAIWITPIVQNRGPLDYHGYHAWDFTKVDPRYESAGATFQDLINAVHAKGMKIVLDIVTNHSGRFGIKGVAEIKYNTDPTQPWGKNLAGTALQDNPSWQYDGMTKNPADGKIWSRANLAKMPAPYNANLAAYNWPSTESFVNTTDANWFHHSGNGFAQGWDDTTNLYQRALAGDCPDLNTESIQVRTYLANAYKTYIQMGVDALRWDTIKHMNKNTTNWFIDQFKAAKPNIFIFGEVAQKRHELHNVTEINPHWYTWRGGVGNSGPSGMSVIDFYGQATFHNVFEAGGNMSGVQEAARYDNLYSDASQLVTWLDNHDFGPNNDWNRRFGGSTENLAACMNFMFTWRGIPSVYYGTEMEFMKGAYTDIHESADIEKSLNLTGRAYFGDAMAQAPNHKIYQQIKKLNAIRKAVPALQKGTWSWGGNGGGNGVGYVREFGSSYAVVGLAKDGTVNFNFSGLKYNGTYKDAVTGASVTVSGGNLSFTVSPSSAGIYIYNGPGLIGGLGVGFFQNSANPGSGGGGGGGTTTVTFTPTTPTAGQTLAVNYNGTLNSSSLVNLYWGYDTWKGVTTTPMTKQANGSWSATITVPASATATFDCVFNNGTGTWDNNGGADWHATVTPASTNNPPTVAISPAGGTFTAPVQVTLSATDDKTASPEIRFTTDGTNPTTESLLYTSPFSVSATTTVKAIAFDGAGLASTIASQSYTINTTTNSFTVRFKKPTTWGSTVNVHFWNRLPGATASTWPGIAMTAEANSWYAYTFSATTSTNLLFVDAGNQNNKTVDLTRSANGWYKDGVWYTSNPDNNVPVLTVNPASKTSATAISVTMSATDADGDAVSIYYTQDGTTPTAASTKYTAAFSVTTTKTIKAIAIDARGGASAVTQRDYTIGTPPAGLIVHFWKPADWTTTVKVHYWNVVPTSVAATTWPGVNATAEGDGWYKYTISGATSASVIFSDNGSTTRKTADLSRTGEGWYINGAWYSAKPSVLKIHYRNLSNWTTPYIYFWNTGTGQTSTWPGKAMELESAGWYCYPIVGTASASIIFSNNGASQSANLTRTGEGWFMNGTWYSTKPAGKEMASDNGEVVSDQFMLFQNYPNPFNPSTSIGFNLSDAGHVKLTVFDLLGREIAVLVDETISTGYHSIQFDASSLPSGVYMYRLVTSQGVLFKKMTLMK